MIVNIHAWKHSLKHRTDALGTRTEIRRIRPTAVQARTRMHNGSPGQHWANAEDDPSAGQP